ncbi:hemerythrin domain-containing protein [Nostoc sp. 106C]|jgi:hemerythrin superfamily protein|uniref:hemerythrin domain-containing protein n=1 Tax=Nostoc sp. 106C TaxID=1932667 RepID=UPI000A39499E|nr:hemerythrin domain-containing protein [Nostoc sp. 106C]OUL21084.1 hemerythrin [Nostoc sp. RF31YmG]OUL28239.1 hemerythrin [Nostoc sp. 106C]
MAKSQTQNILSLIETEHRQVEKLFAEAEKANTNQLYECFNEIYKALTLHTRSEELVFYPAMQEYEETKQYIEEAEAEHEEAKILLEEIKSLKPTDSEFKTKIQELKKAVKHHVEEEESQIFKAISDCMSEQQLAELGKEFLTTKGKLEEEVKTAMTT